MQSNNVIIILLRIIKISLIIGLILMILYCVFWPPPFPDPYQRPNLLTVRIFNNSNKPIRGVEIYTVSNNNIHTTLLKTRRIRNGREWYTFVRSIERFANNRVYFSFKTKDGMRYIYNVLEIPADESRLFLNFSISVGVNGIEKGVISITNYNFYGVFVEYEEGVPSNDGSWDNQIYIWHWHRSRYEGVIPQQTEQ